MLRFLIDGMSYQRVIITWIVDVYTYLHNVFQRETYNNCLETRIIRRLQHNIK